MATPLGASKTGVGGGTVDSVFPAEHNPMASSDTPGRRHKNKKHRVKKGSGRKPRANTTRLHRR